MKRGPRRPNQGLPRRWECSRGASPGRVSRGCGGLCCAALVRRIKLFDPALNRSPATRFQDAPWRLERSLETAHATAHEGPQPTRWSQSETITPTGAPKKQGRPEGSHTTDRGVLIETALIAYRIMGRQRKLPRADLLHTSARPTAKGLNRHAGRRRDPPDRAHLSTHWRSIPSARSARRRTTAGSGRRTDQLTGRLAPGQGSAVAAPTTFAISPQAGVTTRASVRSSLMHPARRHRASRITQTKGTR
jgi:hypothetical protein